MNWSKLFVNILLFATCALVMMRCSSSTDQIKKLKKISMRNNFEDIGEKQAYNVKSKKPNALPRLFEGGGRKQLKREKSERRLNSNPVSAAPRKHDVIDRVKSQRTTESASKTPELNYREMLKQNVVIGRKDVKQTSLRGDIFKGMLSKSHIPDTDPMQSTLNSTTSPNSPSFKIAPVCIGQRSCAGRCTGNMTEFRTDGFSACYCDSACYEIFYDCCADYTKYCGVQKPSNISMKKFKWTCEPLASSGHFRSSQSYVIGEGIWMVSRCPDDWPHDEIRSKCENLTNSLRTISDLRCYIPAVSGDLTFRNYFCAKCNYIDEDLEYFSVKIETNVIPPEHYNFSAKSNFLLSNGAMFPEDELAISPKSYQKRRYCLKSVVQSCSVGASSESCVNGPVALVSLDGKQFKNYDCALCNEPNGSITCFPPLCGFTGQLTLRHKFLLKLEYKDTNNEQDSAFTLLRTNCSYGLIYDAKLQDCVEVLPPPSPKEDKVRVLAWFSPSKDSQFSEQYFKTVMKQYFGVENSQLYNVSIETVTFETIPHQSISYHLVSSTLHLTPEQSFDTFFKLNSDSSRLNLRSFIYFENPLSVTLENITYTIIKTSSRPLSCITHKTYTPQQYLVDKDEQIKIKWTYTVHKKWEYYGQINGNITICEMYSENKCEKIQTGLNKNDFIINTNLSLYQKDTGIQYELEKYDVVNNSIALCNLEQFNVPTCSSENSCKGRCSNHTQWQTETKMRCSCDPDCYEVFNDCCSDYTKYCGAQKPRETLTKKYNYTCESVGHYVHKDYFYPTIYCPEGDGLWMVNRCGSEWPNDTVRTKCELVPENDTNGYLPVLGYGNTTFRNRYCAICNGIERFEPWPLDVEVDSEYLGKKPLRPGKNQTRRYCLNNVIDSCPRGKRFQSCTDGDVALVSHREFHFKNEHCATCFGLPSGTFSCFTWKFEIELCRTTFKGAEDIDTIKFIPLSEFLAILEPEPYEEIVEPILLTINDKRCGSSGKTFNSNSQTCKVNWYPLKQNQRGRFYVNTWLKTPQNYQNSRFTATEFKNSLAKFLNISRFQLFDINIIKPTKRLYIVSSIMALTSQQSLELKSIDLNNQNRSFTKKLFNYIYFSNPFTLQIEDFLHKVTKTISRPLVGVEEITYRPEEYVLKEGKRAFIPSINKSYHSFEYVLKKGNVTVFKKYVLAKCNGSVVLYTTDDYMKMANLSIYVKKTSSLYDYGEYDILPNKSVTICQYFEMRILNKTRQTVRYSKLPGLGYVTFISFLLSILCLIFLLVTYLLFPQLRTLPGKNLMNFAASLLLFQVFWLPLNFTEVTSDKPACKAVAVIEHYSLMASFVGMSVIAFHTCKVFARSLPAPKMSIGRERKLFCVYVFLVWVLPAVFVGICIVLDDQDVVEIGYGESEICWLTKNAYTFFVTIPIGVLLLFNIIAFVITAVYLQKNSQNIAAKQARRSNLSIFIKLSTLMGFTWLFGLLALVVTSTKVFWYFFVILTSLQGVFVAMAFAVNVKTWSLYKQRYASGPKSSATTYAESYQKKHTNNCRETRV